MRNYLLFLGILFGGFSPLWAQVTTIPAVPSAIQSFTIRYDAKLGSGGLVGEERVFVHLGAVTGGATSTTWEVVPFSWGTDNPLALMKAVPGESDLWEYELNPEELFDLDAAEIDRIGIVFRNADGTKEGKTSAGGDFFIDLVQGFEVLFLEPSSNSVILNVGEELIITIAASGISHLSLILDSEEIAKDLAAPTLEYSFVGTVPGTYQIVATAVTETDSAERSLSILVVDSNTEQLPLGVKMGINYLSDTSVALVLQAPGKRNAFVLGDFNDWELHEGFHMKQTPDGEYFWLQINDLNPGEEYIFQYLVDGHIRIGDPYADKISDPHHEAEIIDQGRYSGLKPYPTGKTDFQATFLQTAQEPYDWKYNDYIKPKTEELVIYELLVRDFDERRTYEAVTERLDYLKELGINALQLMPIQEFEGNLSWGYNPSFFFAPDKYYGTKNELKNLIDEAHKRDMVVLLDMVLNHTFGQSPFVRLYNEGDYGAPTEDNPYLNPIAKHPFNVGYDFNHESPYTQALVDSVNAYWLSEYHVDGFRFDLSKGFTQVNSGSNVEAWSSRDESRIAIWKRIYDQIKTQYPDFYVILEHFAANDEEKELADYGMVLWGNMNGVFREMGKGGSRNFEGAFYQNRDWTNNHLLAYMESHDEERIMFDMLNYGARSPVNLTNLPEAINRNQLLTAFYFSIPGPKMIWQFGEFGYDLELNDDRLGIKPTRWDYLDDPHRIRLWNLYQALISLKAELPVLNQPQEVDLDLAGDIKQITLREDGMDLVLVGNFALSAQNNRFISFPSSGTWYNFFTGEEIRLSSQSRAFDFDVNEFYVFTSKPLPKPEAIIFETDPITSILRKPRAEESLKLYPVPAGKELHIGIPFFQNATNFHVYDVQGRSHISGTFPQGESVQTLSTGNLSPGIYVLEIEGQLAPCRKMFIKQ
ncbi:alpha-amylase family glycosyl hydrolase [Lunatibacter salilacus]|uniref:alpha-amylase family glycosyl hydrolase n=1 Tax=Lunatibacter salilacus TaxID=2483804 RepID=UPI00131DD552|nr:alpha-amylase family glycosyl hydrolase [Lunatibacter salilacus]